MWSISNEFSASESRVVYLNGNVYDFSVYYNSIDIFTTLLYSQKYLITENNTELLQLLSTFQTAMVSCSRFICITNSSNQGKVWTAKYEVVT